MGKKCLKCGYERQECDIIIPDYECPKCGVIYAKAPQLISGVMQQENETKVMDVTTMEKRIKYLRASLIFEIILGIPTAGFATILTSIMSTDSFKPTDSLILVYLTMGIAGIFGFAFISIPMILIPFLAIKELKYYNEKRKLLFNKINSTIMIFTMYLIPLAIWQFCMLDKIKKHNENNNINPSQ